MFGADRTLSSRMIANGLLTFSCVTRPKRRAPAVLKVMLMSGRPSWSKLWRGVGQLVARDHHPALDGDGAGAVGHRQDLAARRRAALLDVAGLADRSTSLNSSRAVWPISFFSASGFSTPGTCDQDPVAAFGDDGDFLGAAGIDAAADDVAGDAHRVLQRLGGAARRSES